MYRDWQTTGVALVARGGGSPGYKHYCPLSDVREIAALIPRGGTTEVTKGEIIGTIEGRRLQSGSIFRDDAHGYKIAMVFEYLEDRKLLKRESQRRGRYIVYKLLTSPADFKRAVERVLKNDHATEARAK